MTIVAFWVCIALGIFFTPFGAWFVVVPFFKRLKPIERETVELIGQGILLFGFGIAFFAVAYILDGYISAPIILNGDQQ